MSSKISVDSNPIEIFCFMNLAQGVYGCVHKHTEETWEDDFLGVT